MKGTLSEYRILSRKQSIRVDKITKKTIEVNLGRNKEELYKNTVINKIILSFHPMQTA